jgi:hypothetical protein
VERVLPKRSSQRVCCLILTAHPVARFFIDHGQRAIVCGLRVFVRIADRAVFSRSFLRSAKILLQNGPILRNTLRMLNLQTPSVGNAVQRCENIRNSLGLNYKSAALPAELCRRKRFKALQELQRYNGNSKRIYFKMVASSQTRRLIILADASRQTVAPQFPNF